MADNYLITGYCGFPHVTAENDRGINAAIFGTGRFVLPVGERFRAEYIGNNTIRMYDGKLVDNGAAAGIPAGLYIDLLIPEAGQGMKRNDLIVFQYSKDVSTLIESGNFVVVKGTETAETPEDPALTQEDLLSDEATFEQMALWRVSVSGSVISDPVQMHDVSASIPGVLDELEKKPTIPENHASSATTYGKGSSVYYGHVKLSDSTNNESGVSGGVAATPAAVKAACDLAGGKAPENHASSSNKYGVGSSTNYGHVKLAASFDKTEAENTEGLAASALLTANLYQYFTEIISELDGKAQTNHNQSASTINAGTFAGQVVANSSGQTAGTSLLRNSKIVSTETYPTVNGEINWQYE